MLFGKLNLIKFMHVRKTRSLKERRKHILIFQMKSTKYIKEQQQQQTADNEKLIVKSFAENAK